MQNQKRKKVKGRWGNYREVQRRLLEKRKDTGYKGKGEEENHKEMKITKYVICICKYVQMKPTSLITNIH